MHVLRQHCRVNHIVQYTADSNDSVLSENADLHDLTHQFKKKKNGEHLLAKAQFSDVFFDNGVRVLNST